MMSVDEQRGLIFLPIGFPAYDFYGGDRKGQNLFANSLVALNAGEWETCLVFPNGHHDLWDYDLPAQPLLINISHMAHGVLAGYPHNKQKTGPSSCFAIDLTGNHRDRPCELN